MDFNAAIFDLDGTILDSMDVWEHIDIQFLKKRNLPVPENYVTEICARSFEEAAQYTIDLFGLQETVEGIIEEKTFPDLDVTALKPAILLSGYFLFTTPVLFPSVMILTQLISKVIPEGLILLSSILLASVIAGICP